MVFGFEWILLLPTRTGALPADGRRCRGSSRSLHRWVGARCRSGRLLRQRGVPAVAINPLVEGSCCPFLIMGLRGNVHGYLQDGPQDFLKWLCLTRHWEHTDEEIRGGLLDFEAQATALSGEDAREKGVYWEKENNLEGGRRRRESARGGLVPSLPRFRRRRRPRARDLLGDLVIQSHY